MSKSLPNCRQLDTLHENILKQKNERIKEAKTFSTRKAEKVRWK